MFLYSCFLSYPRGNELLEGFVQALFKGLSEHLSLLTELPVWMDRESIKAGESWQDSLTEALQRSVCWIPVLTPTYFSKQRFYGSREYLAMERIEEIRSRATRHPESLILPVVLRGEPHLPKLVFERRQCFDFSDYLAYGGRQFRTHKFYRHVSELADQVGSLCDKYSKLEKSIELVKLNVSLPSEQEASQWLESATNTLTEP